MKKLIDDYAKWCIENPDLYYKILILVQFVSFPIGLLFLKPIVWAFFAPLVVFNISEVILQLAIKKSGLLIMTEESHPELHKLMVEADAEYIANQVEPLNVEKT